jgi:hypothetical protein
MKTKIFILTICAALIGVSASAKIKDGRALSGNSLTELGKYKVVNAEAPMVINDKAVTTYDLTYENTSETIRIGLVKDGKCLNYIVRTGDFEMQYTCNKGMFGVKKTEKRFQEIPKDEVNVKLDKVSYYSQRVICQNKKSEDELLGLIACYFPALMNEEYLASF